MNKYINGKIYKIIDNTNGNIYIGSTIKTLKRRLECHICMDCISKEIIKNGDYKIELIEVYPCNNDEELRKREQYYIDNNKCINIRNAYTDMKEYKKKYDKEYKNNNKEYYKKYDKEYRINNKDKLKEYNKIYNDNNKDKRKERDNYKYSWGGDKRSNNNLLEIDINILI
jgi:hypothetical protein